MKKKKNFGNNQIIGERNTELGTFFFLWNVADDDDDEQKEQNSS